MADTLVPDGYPPSLESANFHGRTQENWRLSVHRYDHYFSILLCKSMDNFQGLGLWQTARLRCQILFLRPNRRL